MSIAIFSSLLCLPPTFFVFLSNQCQKLNSVLDDKTRASIPCINTMHPNQIQLYRNNMKTYECLLKATLINIVQSLEKVQEVVKKLESWKVQKKWLKNALRLHVAGASVCLSCLPAYYLTKKDKTNPDLFLNKNVFKKSFIFHGRKLLIHEVCV